MAVGTPIVTGLEREKAQCVLYEASSNHFASDLKSLSDTVIT